MGRVLGVDYGRKRIGLALGDPTGFLASAHSVIQVKSKSGAIDQVIAAAREEGVECIVIGHPKNMNGTSSEMTVEVERFAAAVGEQSGLEIRLWDERLTSAGAERSLIEADASRKRRKEVIDMVAAQMILQSYLDASI